MTRASLLHILDHVTQISDAEVRELEQLASAFPYCQTAHLLLAKAASDRGNMLASQRLRRAATYAVDRELLRHLIELTAESAAAAKPVAQSLPEHETAEAAEAEPLTAGEEAPTAAGVAAENVPVAETATGAEEPVAAGISGEESAADAFVAAKGEVEDGQPEIPISEADTADISAEAPPAQTQPASADPAAAATTAGEAPAPGKAAAEEGWQPGNATPTAADEQPVAPEAAQTAVAVSDAEAAPTPAEVPATLPAATASDTATAGPDELPPTAPPIRPPADAGSSRFEFGLADTTLPTTPYQLPGLTDEAAPAPAAPIPAFLADEGLAYALSAGSRLGDSLQPRTDAFTQNLPVAESWYPDGLVQEHLAQYRPAVSPPPATITLIDRFLRVQPRMRAAAPRPMINPEPQADLSVRSTSAAPSLASESLAQIMVKQGKTARAIEIYEQLMVRQPEKKAYFAALIDQLKPTE